MDKKHDVRLVTPFFIVCKVFSRLKHVNLHFMVGGLLNNVFGGLYAGILWLIVEQHINTSKVNVQCISYLFKQLHSLTKRKFKYVIYLS